MSAIGIEAKRNQTKALARSRIVVPAKRVLRVVSASAMASAKKAFAALSTGQALWSLERAIEKADPACNASWTCSTVISAASFAKRHPPLRPPADVTIPWSLKAAIVRRTTTGLVFSIFAMVSDVSLPPRRCI